MKPSEAYNKYRDSKFESRAETFAYWTLPSLFPSVDELKTVNSKDLARDWQSFGAQLVHHLASKFASTLFPLSMPFFKLALTGAVRDVFKQSMNVGDGKLNSVQAKAEVQACARLMVQGNYNRLIHALKLLIVVGNCLIYRAPNGRLQVYSPRHYVVLRDGTGEPLLVVLKEQRAWSLLPEHIRRVVPKREADDHIHLYTQIEWLPPDTDGVQLVHITQEIETWVSEPLPVRSEVNPFIPATWELTPGESLGRGFVESQAGDFGRYSELSYATALYEIEAARVIHFVKPGSGADVDAINRAKSGEYVQGDPNFIEAHESGDGNKLQQLQASLQLLEARLGRAFAWGGSTRDAERVTAYELAKNAAELDVSFGGAHSALSATLHPPLAYLLLQAESPSFIQTVLSGGGQLDMLTGMAALGRSGKLTALLQAAQESRAVYDSVAPMTQRLSPERTFELACAARGADPEEVYRTEEELAELSASTAPQAGNPEEIQSALQGTLQNG
jgi:hypothetical protein